MGTITGRYHWNSLKTARGVAETTEKFPGGHNSGKNQSSLASVKYDQLQVMETIIGKFIKIP